MIRRLSWCGVEIEAEDGAVAVVDVLEDVAPLSQFLGSPAEPVTPLARQGRATIAALTHLHRDHADASALRRALVPDSVVLRPPPQRGQPLETAGTRTAEAELAEHGLRTQVVEVDEVVTHGSLTFTALRGVDAGGDPQHTWLIEADGCRIVHAGDTMWHGEWWLRALRHGPVDVALLPINGPTVDFPHRQPASGLPGAMTPEQAAAAAGAMRARIIVPIHYGLFAKPPYYEPVEDAEARLRTAAEERGVTVRTLEAGEALGVEASDRPDEPEFEK